MARVTLYWKTEQLIKEMRPPQLHPWAGGNLNINPEVQLS
jgi:hypothetical protein